MPGLFSAADQADQINNANRNLGAALPTTPAEAFGAAFEATERNSLWQRQFINENDFVQQVLDRHEETSGEHFDNPMGLSPTPNAPFSDQPLPTWKGKELDALRAKFAETGGHFPSDDEITQGGVALARQAMLRQEQAGQGGQQFGAGVAGVVGGAIPSVADPLNAVAIATIPEGGLAVRMLGAAAGFGGAQLASDLSTYGYSKAVNPEFGPGDVAARAAQAAAGGAAFELGGAAIKATAGAIWRRLKTVAPDVADKMPVEVQDAGNVAERVADLDAQNPFRGPEGEGAHNEALAKIESDLQAERPPELPPAAQEAAVATGPDPAEIEAHARATNPALFAKADALDSDMAQARSALDEVTQPAAAEPTGQIAGRIEDLQGQLDAITGKRKASPAAQAIRDELARLQDQSAQMEAGAGAQAGDREQLLRMRLNDLQQQRAALGPDFNAARGQAEAFLQSHPAAPEPSAPLAGAAPTEAIARPAATAATAFGDRETIAAAAAHPFKNINRMAEAMDSAAPAWQAMRDAAKSGAIPPTQDITGQIMAAIKAIVQARDEGRTIHDVMNNAAIFHSDNAQRAVRLFFDPESGKFLSKAQMTENLKSLADGLREGPKIEQPIKAAPTPDPIIARMTRDATAPEALAKVASDPKVHDAMGADLQRNIEQGRNRVPVDDGKGGVSLGFADKELAGIDAQLAAAKEIGACASPVAEAAE